MGITDGYSDTVASSMPVPNPNQGLQTLSSLLGLQQQKQALIGQRSENISKAAAATVDQQNATEKMAGVWLLSDPFGHGLVDSDGNPTKDAQKIIMQAMPTTGAQHYEALLNGAKAKIEFNRSVNNLSSDERNEVNGVISGVAADPDATKDDAKAQLDAYVESKKGTPVYNDVKRIAGTSQQIMDHTQATQDQAGQIIPPGKEAWRNAGLTLGRTVIGAPAVVGAGGIATGTATTQDLGGTIQPGVTAPPLQGGGFTPAGKPIPKNIPPGYMAGPNGSIIRADNSGLSAPPVNAPAAPSAPTNKLQPLARPSLNAPAADQANYKQRIESAGQEQDAVAKAANDPTNGVQSTRFRNQQILDLIPHAETGPGLKLLNTLASRLPGSTGDAYQDIEHYTAQNSAALAKLMGVPGTNLGAETAAAAAGSVEKNPQALAEITKTNDALNTAFDLYNRGMAKVTNNGSDLSRAAAYKQAFGANLDINAIRWADAHRRKDSEEIKALQSKAGSEGLAEYGRKLNTLKSLATTGDLP